MHIAVRAPLRNTPNVAAEWLPLLIYIREVSASNLGPENGYPYRCLSTIFSGPAGKCQKSTSSRATSVPFHIPSNSLIIQLSELLSAKLHQPQQTYARNTPGIITDLSMQPKND